MYMLHFVFNKVEPLSFGTLIKKSKRFHTLLYNTGKYTRFTLKMLSY